MKRILLSILVLVTGFLLTAQTTISGIIKDAEGQYLAGANVYLVGTYDGASSNSEGAFHLTTDEVGIQILCVDYVGYEGSRKEVFPETYPVFCYHGPGD